MADGEEDGDKGQKPQPNGFKKVVVGVCVMEKKVGEIGSLRFGGDLSSLFCGEFLWLLNFPVGLVVFEFRIARGFCNWKA